MNFKSPLTKLCLIFLIVFFGCRQRVYDDVAEFESKPVINGILIADSLLIVQVSMAQSLDSTDLRLVHNAEVDIFVDDVFAERLTHLGAGEYVAIHPVQENKTYSCVVHIPGFDTIKARTTVPEKPKIHSVLLDKNVWIDEEGLMCPSITFSFTNKPHEEQYFEALILSIHKGWRDFEGYTSSVMLPNITDPVILNEGIPIPIFSNEMISENSYELELIFNTGGSSQSNNNPPVMTLHPTILEFRSLSKDYYDYARQLLLYERGRYPNGFGDVNRGFPLLSNVENAYGIFAGYSAAVSDTIFPNKLP